MLVCNYSTWGLTVRWRFQNGHLQEFFGPDAAWDCACSALSGGLQGVQVTGSRWTCCSAANSRKYFSSFPFFALVSFSAFYTKLLFCLRCGSLIPLRLICEAGEKLVWVPSCCTDWTIGWSANLPSLLWLRGWDWSYPAHLGNFMSLLEDSWKVKHCKEFLTTWCGLICKQSYSFWNSGKIN